MMRQDHFDCEILLIRRQRWRRSASCPHTWVATWQNKLPVSPLTSPSARRRHREIPAHGLCPHAASNPCRQPRAAARAARASAVRHRAAVCVNDHASCARGAAGGRRSRACARQRRAPRVRLRRQQRPHPRADLCQPPEAWAVHVRRHRKHQLVWQPVQHRARARWRHGGLAEAVLPWRFSSDHGSSRTRARRLTSIVALQPHCVAQEVKI